MTMFKRCFENNCPLRSLQFGIAITHQKSKYNRVTKNFTQNVDVSQNSSIINYVSKSVHRTHHTNENCVSVRCFRKQLKTSLTCFCPSKCIPIFVILCCNFC